MKVQNISRNRKHERGISLLETVIAAALMIIGIGGVMSLFTVGASKNMSQGTQASRCTEYAQDKMEQLMALSFSDTNSDTTVIPTYTNTLATGTGLTSGGSVYPSAATTGYVDYVTEGSGTGAAIYSTQQTNSAYMRQWSIVLNSTDSNIKTITVSVKSLQSVVPGAAPTTTLVSMKKSF
jgi:Tfp pilus assembly protein PilV